MRSMFLVFSLALFLTACSTAPQAEAPITASKGDSTQTRQNFSARGVSAEKAGASQDVNLSDLFAVKSEAKPQISKPVTATTETIDDEDASICVGLGCSCSIE